MPRKRNTARSRRAFAKAIRAAREQAGYSQETFARHAGLDRSYYGAIERVVFNVTLETMLAIARDLGMSLGQLCTRAKL
jgi:XRE family transcriptional regulator, regulator of sulfur utilization